MKPVFWIGSSKEDLKDFPVQVRHDAGYALHQAQLGSKSLDAVPMLGFGSAKVIEVVIDHDTNTYRAVYTIKFPEAIYVLHAFQKKSRKGSKTPKPDMDVIRTRLSAAAADYAVRYPKKLSPKGKGK